MQQAPPQGQGGAAPTPPPLSRSVSKIPQLRPSPPASPGASSPPTPHAALSPSGASAAGGLWSTAGGPNPAARPGSTSAGTAPSQPPPWAAGAPLLQQQVASAELRQLRRLSSSSFSSVSGTAATSSAPQQAATAQAAAHGGAVAGSRGLNIPRHDQSLRSSYGSEQGLGISGSRVGRPPTPTGGSLQRSSLPMPLPLPPASGQASQRSSVNGYEPNGSRAADGAGAEGGGGLGPAGSAAASKSNILVAVRLRPLR